MNDLQLARLGALLKQETWNLRELIEIQQLSGQLIKPLLEYYLKYRGVIK